MIEIGRVCKKTAGRESGRFCVVIKKVDDNFVMVTGPKSLTKVKRRRCNIEHLEPLSHKIAIKADASDSDVEQELKKGNVLRKAEAEKEEAMAGPVIEEGTGLVPEGPPAEGAGEPEKAITREEGPKEGERTEPPEPEKKEPEKVHTEKKAGEHKKKEAHKKKLAKTHAKPKSKSKSKPRAKKPAKKANAVKHKKGAKPKKAAKGKKKGKSKKK